MFIFTLYKVLNSSCAVKPRG